MNLHLKKLLSWFLLLLLFCTAGAGIAEELPSITLPKDMKVIRQEAFNGAAIKKVIVPEGLTEIQSKAFANSSLEEINLPASLTIIANDAFYGCKDITIHAQPGSFAYNWAVKNGYIIGFEVHFINVGQADAAVILCDEQVLMIDGGNVDDIDLIQSYLSNTLGIEHIDYLVASHPHDDHIGGLPGAFKACTVGKIYSPVTSFESAEFEALMDHVEQQNLTLTVPAVGDTFNVGSATVQFLSPARMYDDMNDTSIVLKIVYGNTSFLFTADAELEAENDMLASGYDLSATLLKVGHHGSKTSSSAAFLQKIKPQYAIISVGADNTFGHPASAVITRLKNIGAQVYRTDKHGGIICISNGDTLSLTTN